MHRWDWVLRGNGNVSVMCHPTADGTFARNGTSYFHFVIGDVHNEALPNRDYYQRIFVKIGLCQGCFNAGPAGFDCPVCAWSDDCPCDNACGAIRIPWEEHPSDIALEIDPLHVVQRMNRYVEKCSVEYLIDYFGEDAEQPMINENGHYFEWTNAHEALLRSPNSFTHNRPRDGRGSTHRRNHRRRRARVLG